MSCFSVFIAAQKLFWAWVGIGDMWQCKLFCKKDFAQTIYETPFCKKYFEHGLDFGTGGSANYSAIFLQKLFRKRCCAKTILCRGLIWGPLAVQTILQRIFCKNYLGNTVLQKLFWMWVGFGDAWLCNAVLSQLPASGQWTQRCKKEDFFFFFKSIFQ